MKQRAVRVQAALDAAAIACEVVEFAESTRTASQAADAIGCSVAQIAKSIVFSTQDSGQAVMVIASGINRIDEKSVARHVGEKLRRATPEFVRAATGFAIGGVPPCGLAAEVLVFLDEDLLAMTEIWAAAGTPNAVFRLSPAELQTITGGEVIAVKR